MTGRAETLSLKNVPEKAAPLAKFDPTRPYDQIMGQPGLAYKQDGRNFNGRGDLVTDFSALKPVDSVPQGPTPDDGSIPRFFMADQISRESNETQDIETMHWTKLKAMLSIYGEEFTSREEAISFLKGKK